MGRGLNWSKVDMTGKKIGRLTVLKESETRTKHGMVMWECRCDCGNIRNIPGTTLRSGKSNSCGCILLEKIRLKPGEAAFNKLYAGYILGAKQRDLDFSLTKEKFKELTSSNCYYCGIGTSNECGNGKYKKSQFFGNYKYNGIDRVDNKAGYIEDNCVPCCFKCNQMKLALSQEDFLDHINKIVKFQKQNYESNRINGNS